MDFLCTLSPTILTEISLKEYLVSRDEKRHTLNMQETLELNVERHTCVKEVVYRRSPAFCANFCLALDLQLHSKNKVML